MAEKQKKTAWQKFVDGYWAVLLAIGDFMASLILSILYFTVLAVTALAMRLFNSDLLDTVPKDSHWKHRKEQPKADIDRYTHQY